MRPIERGPIPEKTSGQPKSVSDYKDWRLDLIKRIGNFCTYCNMALNDSPQVEHVTAQDIDPSKKLDWDNMVLACGPCNRAKSNKPCPTSSHFLPDFHNTHLAFDYIVIDHPNGRQKACIIVPHAGLNATQKNKAENTIALCKLDILPNTPRASDLRWKYRFDAIEMAKLWRTEWDDWGNRKANQFIALLITAAIAKGFFSIWFIVFEDVAVVKKALVENFPNTHLRSFDVDNGFEPVVRQANDL